jgi:cadmium resistance protein CadD (predicted permease)
MDPTFATMVAAAGLFAATNVDDLVVLAVLNASSRAAGRPKEWEIWAGQYAGVAALTTISLLGALGLAFVPEYWAGVLGLIPLTLGVRKLVHVIRARNSAQRDSPVLVSGLIGVVGLTIANGGDNIAAYTPVFRTLGAGRTAVTIAVFAAGVGVWCLAGYLLVAHPKATQVIRRYGRWVIPAIYILIGCYIISKTGLLGHAL